MQTHYTAEEQIQRRATALEYLKTQPAGKSDLSIAKELKEVDGNLFPTPSGTRHLLKKIRQEKLDPRYTVSEAIGNTVVSSDKKLATVDFWEWTGHLIDHQKLHERASRSQKKANIHIDTPLDELIIQPLSDLHFGAIGADYELLKAYTNMILEIPELYIILAGDMVDNFVNFRNKLAMHQQILSPDQQEEYFTEWLNLIRHKVLFATWGNHEEFDEKATGKNHIKKILNEKNIYFNGIGQADVRINEQKYKIVVTHKTRFHSSFNTTHGLKQLARKDIPDADLYIAGDKHTPAKETAIERGMTQIFLMMGTLKVNDGYSQRYFSYMTNSDMPCVVVSTKTKKMVDFFDISSALKYISKV